MSDAYDLDDIFATADEVEESDDTKELNRLKQLRLEKGNAKVSEGDAAKKQFPSRDKEVRRVKYRAMTELARLHPREFDRIVGRLLDEKKPTA
jgi:hypothetical protein